MTFHLVDKDGHNRKVSAIVKLGFRNKIKSMHALHHRETPLIDVLRRTSINETVRVDFTAYNQNNPRPSKQVISVKNTSVNYQENKHLINDMETFSENKFRLLQLLGLAAIVLIAVFSVGHSFF